MNRFIHTCDRETRQFQHIGLYLADLYGKINFDHIFFNLCALISYILILMVA